MNEYQKLLQHYGVSSQQLPYAGMAKPTDTAASEYADLMSKYTTDRSAYDKWLDSYKQRIAARSVYDPAFTGETLGTPTYEYGAGYTLPKAPVAPTALTSTGSGGGYSGGADGSGPGGGQDFGGVSNAPGGGYGIPGATMVGGISGPTTGLASLANQAAATLGDMSIHPITGLQKTGPLAAMQRSISDALAANVDPSFSHEGRAGRGASIGTAPGGAFTIGPFGLTDIQTPTVEQSEARDTSVSGGREATALAQAQAENAAQAQREAANMASRAQAEREAAAQAARSFDQPGSVASGGGYGGFGGNTGGDGAIGFGGEYAQGGLAKMVQRYAVGGPVSGPPNVYQSAEMNRSFSNPDTPMQEDAAATPMASNEDVAAMFEKYQALQQPVSPYAQELAAARKTASEQTEAFNQMLQKAISAPGEAAPSKAEMYFQLAAAFGAPTRTGSFTESLGKAGEVMGEQQKAQRAAQKAQRAQALTLGLEGQKMKMQTAKEDLATLRTLAGEEMKDVRVTSLEALKDKRARELEDLKDRRARELEDLKDKRARDLEALREKYKTGAPASEAGKLAADAGLVRGTPEFNKFVSRYIDEKMASGNEYKAIMAGIAQQGLELRRQAGERAAEQAKKLTPQEMKLKTETEDMVAQTDQALANLKQAYSLNANTFDASAVDVAQRKVLEAVGSKDPKVVNTREMENLLEKAALSQLKATFPGAISNDERKALQDVQGLSSKSKEERDLIMKNGYKALKAVRERSAKRLNEINQGLYRDTSTTAGELE